MEIGSSLSTQVRQAGEERAIQSIQMPKSSNDGERIEKGAREFEAVLFGSWLQQAEASFATLPGADTDEDIGRAQFMSLGVQALSTSISGAGGIGIGTMIAAAMHKNVNGAGLESGGAVTESTGPELK